MGVLVRASLLTRGARGSLVDRVSYMFYGRLSALLQRVEEGRADLVVAKLARADDELAGRVGDGVAELHVVDRGSWRLDDDRRSSWTIDLSYFSPRPLRRIPGTAARFSHSARALCTRFSLSFTFRLLC